MRHHRRQIIKPIDKRCNFGGKYPNMDMISCGPTIKYPHSPDEKVNIASVEKFWKFLCHTLETIPVK